MCSVLSENRIKIKYYGNYKNVKYFIIKILIDI